MKTYIKKILGNNKETPLYQFSSSLYKRFAPYFTIFTNAFYDIYFFSRHSNVFNVNTLNKMEARIILDYHSIEKGLLHKKLRFGFGKEKIIRLQKYLNNKEVQQHLNFSQLRVAYQVVCSYYDLHKKHQYNTENYLSESTYLHYKNLLKENYSQDFKAYLNFDYDTYFSNSDASFKDFSVSRKSVRNFSSQLVSDELIQKALKLATYAPSVCNRQPSKVYYIKNKSKIDQILEIQAGLEGFSKNIQQLLVVTSDVSYFYLIGERYQHYIDGGIFLMNLLYALHFYKIGACPANWAKEISDEKKIKKILPIQESEKVICIVAIGTPDSAFKTTLSKRREKQEILTIIE